MHKGINKINILLLIIIISLTLLLVTPKAVTAKIGNNAPTSSDIYAIDQTSLMNHMKYFSSLNTRVTGYDGCYAAADYIADVFSSYGYNVTPQNYSVTVPLDVDSFVTIVSGGIPEKLEAYALWPNSVQTCPTPIEGVTGKLVYVGNGELKDFDGKEVEGSIVLMEFNTGDNWINAAKLGASAVIFVEPSETNYPECIKKFVQTPIHFPRLYVKEEVGAYLRRLATSSEVTVLIKSRMMYRDIRARNVIARIDGTRYPNDIVIISAHYDSWSVVPEVSPGAEEALSISLLLEIAKYFKDNKPLRTLWFVAFSGYWEALAGSREFVENYFYTEDVKQGKIVPWIHISLDLSTDSNLVDLLLAGHAYKHGTGTVGTAIIPRYSWVRSRILNVYVPSVLPQRKGIEEFLYDGFNPDVWWGTQPAPYILDSEPSSVAGMVAFSLRTSHAQRFRWGTPLDDLSYINLNNTENQFLVAQSIIKGLANDTEWQMNPSDIALAASTRGPTPGGARFGTAGFRGGLVTALCSVLTYNLTKGWYNPIPGVLVSVNLGRDRHKTYPFTLIMGFSDDEGVFTVHGIPPHGTTWDGGTLNAVPFEAWIINETDGVIEYAPEAGTYRTAGVINPISHPISASVTITKLKPITIYDLLDPRYYRRSFIPDPRILEDPPAAAFLARVSSLQPFDFDTKSELLFWSSYYLLDEPLGMVFVPENKSVFIVFKTQGLAYPAILLTNTSASYIDGEPPTGYEGNGFGVQGRKLDITFTAYRSAIDEYLITRSRYNKLQEYLIRSSSLETALSKAYDQLAKAQYYFTLEGGRKYSVAYSSALAALSWTNVAYNGELMSLIYDSSRTSVVFLALMIPFALSIEGLIFRFRGQKEIYTLIAICALYVGLFYLVHPALSQMANSLMTLMGMVALTLFVVVIIVLTNQVSRIITSIRVKRLGEHRIETLGAVQTMMIAFPVAVEHMKRRRLRSALSITTLIAIAIASTSLTSISQYTTVKTIPVAADAPYEGMLIKQYYSAPPNDVLDTYLIDYLRAYIGDGLTIHPRIWYYPESVYLRGVTSEVSSSYASVNINAFLGITPEESEILLSKWLIKGHHFLNTSYYACILSEDISRILHVDMGDFIKLHEIKLQVIGITLAGMKLNDLDGISISPIDPSSVPALYLQPIGGEAPSVPRILPWSSVLIIPHKMALDLGGFVSSISIKYLESKSAKFEELDSKARNIVLSTDLGMLVSSGGISYHYTRTTAQTFLAWGFIPFVIAIGALNILIAMLGSVHERVREIFVFSSIGLSPLGSSILYLFESAVLATVGVIIGFLIGFVFNKAFIMFGLLPESFVFNYASIFIVLTIVVSILATLSSATYPAIKAAKIITPSLERRWAIPTKPKGDEWNIPLPTRLVSIENLYDLLEFLSEYYVGEGAEKRVHRVLSTPTTNREEMALKVVVSLPPFESHVTQEVTVKGSLSAKENVYNININLKWFSGIKSVWRSANYGFVDDLRKQVLLWGTLGREVETPKYVQEATKPSSSEDQSSS